MYHFRQADGLGGGSELHPRRLRFGGRASDPGRRRHPLHDRHRQGHRAEDGRPQERLGVPRRGFAVPPLSRNSMKMAFFWKQSFKCCSFRTSRNKLNRVSCQTDGYKFTCNFN